MFNPKMFVGEEVASKLDRGAAASNLVTLDCILPLLVIIMVMMIIRTVTLDCILSLLMIIMVMIIQEIISSLD